MAGVPDTVALLPDPGQLGAWRQGVRQAVLTKVARSDAARCGADLGACGVDVAGEVLTEFVKDGKCLCSTFMYLGWLCCAPHDGTALAAAASLELLQAFALLQDDVMDASPSRRGRPSAHVEFTEWHRRRGLSGSSQKFCESAAILIGDLCLVWAEQMLHDNGVQQDALGGAWPRYDAMRTELAVGQFADVATDLRDLPTVDSVLAVARMKSGNYTVRRPLKIGAAMAGCDDVVLTGLSKYGAALVEAFQLRDDMLSVFGSPTATGKPNGGDLNERKATSMVVAAYQLADASTHRQFGDLINRAHLDDEAVEHWRTLILASGAVQCIEELIDDRVGTARKALDGRPFDEAALAALIDMTDVCTRRAA
ncbi:polyprenyl synthetase family protein [Mycobacterium tilburgii]|uniref:polyprenyl synthetase family protein n=1 Tax=Mycobacterium tilburgii TaxID=44467 RepID=UPI003898D6FC